MPSSCKEIRAALAECLEHSDCVFVERNKPGDCLRAPLFDTLPTRCQQLKKGYGDCKRGMVDMRKRFRGNYPIAVEEMTSGKKGGDVNASPGGQLYAGKSYYSQESSDTIGAREEK
ncbi:cytochrome c oxidase assembly protein PET191-domain-containing protein, partial [Peziza echinospora]